MLSHTVTKILIYVFLFWELRGLSPNQFPHSWVCERFTVYIPRIYPHVSCSRIGRSIVGIYKSLTDTWMWKLAMSNQRSFKIESFRFGAFVPKKIEYIHFWNKILDRNKTFSISTRKFWAKTFCSGPFPNFFETTKCSFCI